ncbi:MAG: hypothetical protein GC162_13015 [Planctomycetes bacterium]|nr:hypothetical protein [Planctomycetota bacterium]
MQCPVCKTIALQNGQIEPRLATMVCTVCGGHWIKSFQYWKWRDQHGADMPELPAIPGALSGAAAKSGGVMSPPDKARLCPDCGHLMTRYPVGHDTRVTLDHCGNCGGMWFDAGEWQTLKARNLHDDVHKIFSVVWQVNVARAQRAQSRETRLRERLGDADYEKIRDVRQWIDAHDQSHALRAYLMHGQ